MVTNEIISGVAIKLNNAFGDEYRIYRNDVEQGFNTPCFFILMLDLLRTPYLGERVKLTIPLDVHFFPADSNDNKTMLEVGDTLLSALTHITTPDGSGFRGHNISYQIEDDILHFFVTYTTILNRFDVKEDMEELTVKQRLRGV